VNVYLAITLRIKQPYSSTKQVLCSKFAESTISIPQVQKCVNLGDFCDKSVNRWSIGHVDQFSKYKEKLKSKRQFKDSKAPLLLNIGALRTWFTCSTDHCNTLIGKPLTTYLLPHHTFVHYQLVA